MAKPDPLPNHVTKESVQAHHEFWAMRHAEVRGHYDPVTGQVKPTPQDYLDALSPAITSSQAELNALKAKREEHEKLAEAKEKESRAKWGQTRGQGRKIVVGMSASGDPVTMILADGILIPIMIVVDGATLLFRAGKWVMKDRAEAAPRATPDRRVARNRGVAGRRRDAPPRQPTDHPQSPDREETNPITAPKASNGSNPT